MLSGVILPLGLVRTFVTNKMISSLFAGNSFLEASVGVAGVEWLDPPSPWTSEFKRR